MTAMLESYTLTERQERNRKIIRWWLYVIVFLCVIIVAIGGATRMTGSGLSITEWKPIHGTIPPLDEAQWQEEFSKYQQIAQYKELNQGMSLAHFKTIFWWEWAHRLIARLVGVIAIVGFFYFLARGMIERKHILPLFCVPVLVGIQGAIGWWMVSSGIGESSLIYVSQYRLAIHLVTACILIVVVLAMARGFVEYSEKPTSRSMQHFAGWMVFLILFQIYLGAFVAGLHAGLKYNTWPLMDGKIIPDHLYNSALGWRNFFENEMMVQFIHRMFAYFLLFIAVVHALMMQKIFPETRHAKRAMILLVLIIVQAVCGIITLLTYVPIEWGIIHQVFALVVLCFATAHWRATKGAYPAPKVDSLSSKKNVA